MKLFKKLFAIVLCLALVLSTVPMMLSFADDVPVMAKPEGSVVIYEGVKFSKQLGSSAIENSWLPGYNPSYCAMPEDNPSVNADGQLDLRNFDYIEFDFYTASVANFKSRVSVINAETYRNGSNPFALPFTDYITKDGWNHVKLPIPKGVNDTVLKRTIQIRFRLTMSASSVGASDVYKIANLAATLHMEDDSVPEMEKPEGSVVIYEGVKFSKQLGSSAIENSWLPGYNPSYCDTPNKEQLDLRNFDYLEFDFYTANVANFKTRVSVINADAYRDGSNPFAIPFTDLITKDGWNHVKLPIPKGVNDTVLKRTIQIRFRLTMSASDVGATDTYKIANVAATLNDGTEQLKNIHQSVTVGKDESEIIVTWLDTEDTTGKVVLTTNGIETEFVADKRFAEEKKIYSYSATITGLTANTNYTYRIVAGEYVTEEYPFETQDFDDTFSFVHISDVQLTSDSNLLNKWNKTLTAINTNFPDTSFIVNTGDISDSSSSNDYYQYVKSPALAKQYAMGVVPGNHDNSSSDEGGGYYTLNFTSPNTYEPYEGRALSGCDYWYSYNNILFIALNSLISNVGYHKDFVTKVITEQGDKFDWIIVNCHFSLFSASYHANEAATITQREGLAPLFSKLGVDIVLSGHDHCYDRSYIMNGTKALVSANGFSTSSEGVLYVSGTTASGMKYNTAVEGCEEYSAKIVEQEYGFVNCEVSEDEINLTFYKTEDMSVLDSFTLYNDNGDHTVTPDSDLLKDRNLENVKLDSNGEYTATFNAADISETCAVELDLGLATGSTIDTINVALVDANGNSINKDFTGLVNGWNHLSVVIDGVPGIDLTQIVAIKLQGTAGAELDIANLYVGHTYTDRKDTTCENCDFVRENNDIINPDIIPEMANTYTTFDAVEGNLHTIKGLTPGKDIYQNYTHYFRLPNALDTTKGEYIEFDLFVSEATDRSFSFWVSGDRESGVRGRYTIPANLTKGWNHIVIDATRPIATAIGNYVFNGCEFDYPFFEGTPYSSNHATGGDIKIANLAVTYKEPAIVYTFDTTMQLKTTEPWGMAFNAYVKTNDTVVDYATLKAYGMYIMAKDGDATVENIIANGKELKVELVTDENGVMMIQAIYDDIATYEMAKEYYAVFYATDKNGNVSYDEVKTRSYQTVIDQYQDAEAGAYTEKLLTLCNKMDAIAVAANAYRDHFEGRYQLKETTPDAAANYGFTVGNGGEYTFSHTMQMTSIEPWALIFNASVALNGETIDYTSVDDYGVIILAEGETAPTIEEMIANEEALVYSAKNGSAYIKEDGYISVDYTNGIYTSEMAKSHYAVFFVEVNGVYTFGEVKTRSMMNIAEQYLENIESYEDGEVLANLIVAMQELYAATVAYYAN